DRVFLRKYERGGRLLPAAQVSPVQDCKEMPALRWRFHLLPPNSTENKLSPKDTHERCGRSLLQNSGAEIASTRNTAWGSTETAAARDSTIPGGPAHLRSISVHGDFVQRSTSEKPLTTNTTT